ncbi:hypothetical protein DPMN_141795 [Dreissena polymorpha]|uniref:Uncharacterized protein n=1 Tax=Dreissena polymorpha TaxID=45954 RepID=A0A9D4GA47_DREPO|nr:hypothetical protein DPMN_141795 [Dreissena polymorpha]
MMSRKEKANGELDMVRANGVLVMRRVNGELDMGIENGELDMREKIVGSIWGEQMLSWIWESRW